MEDQECPGVLRLLLTNCWVQVTIALAAVVFGLIYHKKQKNQQKRHELQKEWNRAGKDVVVLHMPPRAIHGPNPSPFPVKLETWIRINNIKYITDFKEGKSDKNKTPWITVNGVNVADSQLAIEHLKKVLKIDDSSHLTKEQRGIARMVRITAEEHLYFCLLIEGYIHHDGKHALSHYPPKLFTPYPWMTKLFLMTLFKSAIKKMVWEQGLGRHSKEELREIGMKCLESISLLLGNKKYILGDKPCEEDSALFGQLSWMLYCMREDNFFKFETRQKFPNIVDYVERTRQEYWKDWEQMKYKEE